MVQGFCDNLLTSVFRAWDTTDEKKSIIVVPAMNTMMWRNAMTQRHLDELHNIYRVSTITPVRSCSPTPCTSAAAHVTFALESSSMPLD